MAKTSYSDKLKDPRWQKRRLEILERDGWMCQSCQDNESMLVVHHRFYEKGEPWEAKDCVLITLCQQCHEQEHEAYPIHSEALVQALKSKGFLSHDITNIVHAFMRMNVINSPEYMASLLLFAVTDDDTMQIISNRFRLDLSAKLEIKKSKKSDSNV